MIMDKSAKQQEKRARFARIFPARVDTLRDTLRKIANCSNKGAYDWDAEKVQEAWKLIAEEFADTAGKYGISFEVKVSQQDL
jgi:hypothetical protein|tara:strand:- start:437 stop:682 length:246 start_codon:yes stop_codon:yes gene_type:complete